MGGEQWCRVVVIDPHGRQLAACRLEGLGPTLAAVDLVALIALWARRQGAYAELRDLDPAMTGLLDLAGLACSGISGVEMEGKPEGGKQALRIHHGEEEVHPCDPAG
ncbi:MAG: hypothetical protein JO337_03780 [Acidimicrobiales bacterium]|nr:hypothetical protein [Acidimicrobiales bacterium]